MSAFSIVETDKSLIAVGDAIVHDGRERTVCKKDITRCSLFGIKLFGDSYSLGRKLVKKMVYNDPRKRV